METSFEGQKRNKRGEWRPEEPITYAPVLTWPPKPAGILKWFFGYPGFLFPWNAIYIAIAMGTWLFLTPPLEEMRQFAFGWVAFVLARNLCILLLVLAGWHGWLYIKRAQSTDWKYTNKWLARDNPIFLFRNQVYDNLFWNVASAVPIWTAYEVVTYWMYANGYIAFLSPSDHPVWFAVLMCLVPIIRDFHFYVVHRLIHIGPLYRWVHYLHHNNVNVGPLTGLSMHPVEHLLYFSGILLHWVIPSHPIHAIFHIQHAALTPAQGHAGFDRVVLADGVAVGTGDFFHYLHHKYFECNYGADGALPLDAWFGTFHDGTEQATDRMNERFLARAKQKQAAERG